MAPTQDRPPEAEPGPPESGPSEPGPPAGNRGPVAALVVVLLLVVVGFLLTQALRKNANIQDCVASGRTNCAPVATGTN